MFTLDNIGSANVVDLKKPRSFLNVMSSINLHMKDELGEVMWSSTNIMSGMTICHIVYLHQSHLFLLNEVKRRKHRYYGSLFWVKNYVIDLHHREVNRQERDR